MSVKKTENSVSTMMWLVAIVLTSIMFLFAIRFQDKNSILFAALWIVVMICGLILHFRDLTSKGKRMLGRWIEGIGIGMFAGVVLSPYNAVFPYRFASCLFLIVLGGYIYEKNSK